MIRVEHTVVIDRPIEEVFAFMAEVENLPRWAEKTVEARQTSEGPVSAGTTCTVLNKAMGREMQHDFVVTEYEPYTRYAAKSTSGPFPMHMRYSLEPSDGGTMVHTVSEADLGGVARIAAPVLTGMARKQIAADHRRLKAMLESQAPSKEGGSGGVGCSRRIDS